MSEGERRRGRSAISFIFELVLIAAGVFLGLLANNWHEEREHQNKAQEAIRSFLAEAQTNLAATQSNRAYHEKLMQELTEFLASAEPATEERLARQVHFTGVRPVVFEHTAWDLALATQSLAYLPSPIAFEVSKVYTQQAAFQTLENNFLTAAYMPGAMAAENLKGFATALRIYMGDVNVQEPAIIAQQEKVIPQLKAALEDPDRRGNFWSRLFSPVSRH